MRTRRARARREIGRASIVGYCDSIRREEMLSRAEPNSVLVHWQGRSGRVTRIDTTMQQLEVRKADAWPPDTLRGLSESEAGSRYRTIGFQRKSSKVKRSLCSHACKLVANNSRPPRQSEAGSTAEIGRLQVHRLTPPYHCQVCANFALYALLGLSDAPHTRRCSASPRKEVKYTQRSVLYFENSMIRQYTAICPVRFRAARNSIANVENKVFADFCTSRPLTNIHACAKIQSYLVIRSRFTFLLLTLVPSVCFERFSSDSETQEETEEADSSKHSKSEGFALWPHVCCCGEQGARYERASSSTCC